MTTTADDLLTWPGKSADQRGIAHPALYHMLDVAAVAERLIAAEPFPPRLRDALILLTALHDLGKISDSFRAMLASGQRQYRPHWEMTEVLLFHHSDLLAGFLAGRGGSGNSFMPRLRGVLGGLRPRRLRRPEPAKGDRTAGHCRCRPDHRSASQRCGPTRRRGRDGFQDPQGECEDRGNVARRAGETVSIPVFASVRSAFRCMTPRPQWRRPRSSGISGDALRIVRRVMR